MKREKEVQETAKAPDAAGYPSSGRLKGRRIVVTGAASGIGRCTAQLFAEEGASVILLDRDGAGVSKAAQDTGGYGFEVDITDERSVADAVARGAAVTGGMDGLVNAAGIMFRGPVSEVTADAWRHVLEVNLTGTYVVVRSCLQWLMREPGATIVNIGSAQGLLPNSPGHTAYAASKGGVVNLTRALAAEFAPKIRVNSVCPGMVNTQMADGVRSDTSAYALKRLAEPVEIARVILFLTSFESSYVTGATLAADGGRSFH